MTIIVANSPYFAKHILEKINSSQIPFFFSMVGN
jgi:hypothetical protein